jgi:hypothetical protein
LKLKVTEPSFHTIQLESVAGKEPYTKIPYPRKWRNHLLLIKTVFKKSKSFRYSNDEYVKFNEKLK